MKASFETTEFHDIYHYMECAASIADIHSVQIQPGSLSIKNHCLEFDDLIVNHYSANQNILDRFSIDSKYLHFVLTSSKTFGGKWCGIDVPVNSIGVLHPRREHHSLVPADWDSIGITIKNKTVLQEWLLSENMWRQTLQPESAIFNHESLRIASFQTKLSRYFQFPGILNLLVNNEPARLKFRNWVLHELRMIFIEIEAYQSQHHTPDRKSSRRYITYSRAMTVIETNLADHLSVKQISDRIGVTPRTLQLCFKELSGVSPHQYITARRLQAVHRELFYLKNSTKSISNIAQDCGLQHAGRFSSHYKRLFLELPRETLKRREELMRNEIGQA